jgi:hypothetical protein
MERTSESDESGPSAGPIAIAIASTSPRRPPSAPARRARRAVPLILASILLAVAPLRADTLAKVRASGVLSYASDKEGGGPYAFPDRLGWPLISCSRKCERRRPMKFDFASEKVVFRWTLPMGKMLAISRLTPKDSPRSQNAEPSRQGPSERARIA